MTPSLLEAKGDRGTSSHLASVDPSAVNCGQQQPGPLSFFELELNLVVALSQSADQTFGTASQST